MIYKSKLTFLTIIFYLIFFLIACDDQTQVKKTPVTNVVSGEIVQPVIKSKPESPKADKENEVNQKEIQMVEVKSDPEIPEQKADMEKDEQYDSQGKIDPFKPLIQEKTEEIMPKSIDDERPKRILTPLEKIELSQIRLVAVIISKSKRIAMVEEANGKGYEVGIGTYIGKNQGKVSEIKNSSIVVTELVKDFQGKLKEHVQEIKLHKIDNEE